MDCFNDQKFSTVGPMPIGLGAAISMNLESRKSIPGGWSD